MILSPWKWALCWAVLGAMVVCDVGEVATNGFRPEYWWPGFMEVVLLIMLLGVRWLERRDSNSLPPK